MGDLIQSLWRQSKDNTKLLNVKVIPKASRSAIGEVLEDANGVSWLKIYVTAPADKNKANESVIELLAKQLNIAKSKIILIKGHTSSQKIFEIKN